MTGLNRARYVNSPTQGEEADLCPLTRFGFQYIRQLLEVQNRRIELIFETDTNDELVDDFVAVITSMAARMYGRRHAKQRALCIKDCLAQCLEKNYENHTRV